MRHNSHESIFRVKWLREDGTGPEGSAPMSCPLVVTLAWRCLRSFVCKPDLTTDYSVEAPDYYMRM